MTAHYQEFRIHDPAVIARIVRRWPFATIVANGSEWPAIAHAPLTLAGQTEEQALGAVEFHLAKVNPAQVVIGPAAPVTMSILGPSAHVSPTWYKGRFPDAVSDRSKTAPTWDYLALTLRGRLTALADAELVAHLSDLVGQTEGESGWRISEIDAGFYVRLRKHIVGYRMQIEAFDCLAKFSQDEKAPDTIGIAAGLRKRAHGQDLSVAELVEDLTAIIE